VRVFLGCYHCCAMMCVVAGRRGLQSLQEAGGQLVWTSGEKPGLEMCPGPTSRSTGGDPGEEREGQWVWYRSQEALMAGGQEEESSK
jgi:hypothetical protein